MADLHKARSRATHYKRPRAPHACFVLNSPVVVDDVSVLRPKAKCDWRRDTHLRVLDERFVPHPRTAALAPGSAHASSRKRKHCLDRGCKPPLVTPHDGVHGPLTPTAKKTRRAATSTVGAICDGQRASSIVTSGGRRCLSPECPVIPMHGRQTLATWTFELRRSGEAKCCCRAVPQTVPVDRQMPRAVDVVQLPYLSKAREFLESNRHDVQRCVYELSPDTMADWNAYGEFRDYLIKGRNNYARAGRALEMKQQGYDIFVLPPGGAARLVGYHGNQMIAVLRARY